MEEQLLFRSLNGQTTPAEEAAVLAWRRESAENERAYRELAEVLAATDAWGQSIETRPPSPFKLIHLIASRRSADRAPVEPSGQRWRWRLWFGGMAAAAALLVYVDVVQVGLPIAARGELKADEFVTGASETATVTLRDGTVVRLAPQSRLRLSGRRGAREVWLRGRAFFAVAKDPTRPFVIETSAGRVEVLGTRFEIQAEADDMRVLVVEGRVALLGRAGKAEIRAGEMRRVVAGTTLPAVKVPDLVASVSWMGNFLVFQETPLGRAAREIERLYDVHIEITDSALALQTITTWFADQPLEQVTTIFCMVAEARCTESEGRITVSPERSR
jgi:transmembrane sensor